MPNALPSHFAGRARPVSAVDKPLPAAGYLRGLPGGPLSMPGLAMPRFRDAGVDVARAWGQAASRAIDAMQNNGWVAGVVDQMGALMVGEGLVPQLKSDFSAFGWDARQSAEWASEREKRFIAWANNPHECDAGGRQTLGQMQMAAVRQWAGTGECFVEYPVIRRAGGQWASKVRLLPTGWMSRRTDSSQRLRQGVFLDRHGAPAGYLFEVDRDHGLREEIRKPARDGYGRPVVLQVCDLAPNQVRGITIFAPVLRVFRDYDEFMRASLTQQMIQTVLAATIESDHPTPEIIAGLQDMAEQSDAAADPYGNYMAQRVGMLETVDIDLGRHGKIAHLPDGAHFRFNTPSTHAGNQQVIVNSLLREVARCVGGSEEDVTGDYRGVTYTGVRMGIAKQWPTLLYRRKLIPAPISQAALDAFIEEEVDSGAAPVPGGMEAFLANKAAICRADWRGPAKPVADEVKQARTHEIYRAMGVISDEQICADLGTDRDTVYQTRAFEQAQRDELAIHGGITNGGSDIDEMIADSDRREEALANG